MKKKIPVIVVSGFLGSGKTTFLRYLLKESNKKFGLIINEFGDVGIDGDLIKSCDKCDESEDDCVIELNNGCLCCTVQDDFVPSIKALLEFNPPIESNEGVIFYSEQITTKSATLETLIKLKELGVDSNRILLITAICSNKGLNEIAKLLPNQVIYTSCIDEEDEKTQLLVPGIGNPLSRLSTIFQDKN